MQHDAQEFFIQFVEKLDCELRAAARLCSGEHSIVSPTKRGVLCVTCRDFSAILMCSTPTGRRVKKRLIQADSLACTTSVNDKNTHVGCLFRGKLHSVVVCQRCRHESLTVQPMWQVALDVPNIGGSGGSRRARREPENDTGPRVTLSAQLKAFSGAFDCLRRFAFVTFLTSSVSHSVGISTAGIVCV